MSLHVAVDDPSPVWPGRRTPDLTGRTGGFGRAMVTKLADGLVVRPRRGGGKTVAAFLTR